MFSSLDESVQTKVILGINIQVIVLCKGSINILNKKGEHRVTSDVYYVSGLDNTLMNRGQLLQKGYRLYMEDNHCVIMDKFLSNLLIVKNEMTSNKCVPLTLKPTTKNNTEPIVDKLHLQQKVHEVLIKKIVHAVSRKEKMAYK
jgi:hypothetical protein